MRRPNPGHTHTLWVLPTHLPRCCVFPRTLLPLLLHNHFVIKFQLVLRSFRLEKSESSDMKGDTALPCAGKGDHPNELDLAEVQIQVNQESKETFDFDQGTRKYGHIKFSQSIGLPPRNSYLVAIQELAARACLLVFCKLLQTFLQTQSLPSRNSQPCVFRRLYKIQCIPKLPEPWFKFKNFETKAMRRS